MHAHRADVGEHVELAAQLEQPRLTAVLATEVVPGRSADGPEQHGVRIAARIERLVGQRGAVLVDRAAADHMHVDAHLRISGGAHAGQHAERGVDHLGAHPVAREDDDVCRHVDTPGAAEIRHPRWLLRLERGDRLLVLERQGDVVVPSSRRLRTNGSR